MTKKKAFQCRLTPSKILIRFKSKCFLLTVTVTLNLWSCCAYIAFYIGTVMGVVCLIAFIECMDNLSLPYALHANVTEKHTLNQSKNIYT